LSISKLFIEGDMSMATKVVTLENPDNKKVKTVKVGFSLGFLLLGPLWFYFKGLPWKGFWWIFVFVFVGKFFVDLAEVRSDYFNFGVFVVNIYLSWTGNKKVGKSLIKKGFVFLEPGSDSALLAKSKWGVEIPVKEKPLESIEGDSQEVEALVEGKSSEETEEQRQKEEIKGNTVQVYKQGGFYQWISDPSRNDFGWAGDLSLDETDRTISLKPSFLQPTGKFSYKISDVKELAVGKYFTTWVIPKKCHKLIFNDGRKFLFIFHSKEEGKNFLEKCANVGLSLPQEQKIYAATGGSIFGIVKDLIGG
jgi:hypothetical protein